MSFLTIASVCSAAAAQPESVDSAVTIGGPGGGGLLVLEDGTAIHWGNQAHIRVRTPTGDWIGFVPSEINRIEALVPDKEGILISGAYYQPHREYVVLILLIDRRGRVVDRWKSSARFLSSIFSHGGRRWATFYDPRKRTQHQDESGHDPWPAVPTDPLVELLPGGKFEQREVIDPLARIVSLQGGLDGDRRVECIPSDDTMHHFHPAYCLPADPPLCPTH